MVVNGMMIASGTASVVDEDTLHPGDVLAQWHETMKNLDALSEAAGAKAGWLSVRIYARSALHRQTICHLAESAFGPAVDAVLIAPLCRTDLLVEVEGVRVV
jgi:enamine deaminase RidA (YjgF/YER057c/UK114 family)